MKYQTIGQNNVILKEGDTVVTYHTGEECIFRYGSMPTRGSKAGKVVVSRPDSPRDTREMYATVFCVVVTEERMTDG